MQKFIRAALIYTGITTIFLTQFDEATVSGSFVSETADLITTYCQLQNFKTQSSSIQITKSVQLSSDYNEFIQVYVDKHVNKYRKPTYTGSIQIDTHVVRLNSLDAEFLYKRIEDQEDILRLKNI